LKEIKLSYGIEENDLKLKIEKAKELLQKGYGVRFTLRLR
jgi:translation initiation factor IF-3